MALLINTPLTDFPIYYVFDDVRLHVVTDLTPFANYEVLGIRNDGQSIYIKGVYHDSSLQE